MVADLSREVSLTNDFVIDMISLTRSLELL